MEEEIKSFILSTLKVAYSNAEDDMRRAELQYDRMPFDLDNNEALARYRKTEATAKKALAYFGVYR